MRGVSIGENAGGEGEWERGRVDINGRSMAPVVHQLDDFEERMYYKNRTEQAVENHGVRYGMGM